jgi:hypothetical protein
MKKMVLKKGAKKVEKTAKNNVATLIRVSFKADKDYPFEKLQKQVKAINPKSKFNKAQYFWYKSAAKHGRLKGMK